MNLTSLDAASCLPSIEHQQQNKIELKSVYRKELNAFKNVSSLFVTLCSNAS